MKTKIVICRYIFNLCIKLSNIFLRLKDQRSRSRVVTEHIKVMLPWVKKIESYNNIMDVSMLKRYCLLLFNAISVKTFLHDWNFYFIPVIALWRHFKQTRLVTLNKNALQLWWEILWKWRFYHLDTIILNGKKNEMKNKFKLRYWCTWLIFVHYVICNHFHYYSISFMNMVFWKLILFKSTFNNAVSI